MNKVFQMIVVFCIVSLTMGFVPQKEEVIRCSQIRSKLVEGSSTKEKYGKPEKKVVKKNTEKKKVPVKKNYYEAVFESTAYTHTGDPTATGIMPYVGVIAVDPGVIPLGTHVYVEGYGDAIAADTGGAIQGEIIDVFLESEEECIQWGRRYVKIYVYYD